MKTTRRSFLSTAAAASMIAAPAAAAVPNKAEGIEENPELIQAYEDIVTARAKVGEAKEALQWLKDEWRHRWPVAPEDILGFANADRSGGTSYATAERDIAGDFIYRNTHDLPNRMSHRRGSPNEVLCFSVVNPEWIQEIIDKWSKPQTARTPKALAKRLADQERILTKARKDLALSEAYYAETARTRLASGIDMAKQRIKDAKNEVRKATDRASRLPALTHYGLRIKACAIANGSEFSGLLGVPGPIGEMARLVDAIIDIPREISA